MGTVAVLEWARTLPDLKRLSTLAPAPSTSTTDRIVRASRSPKTATSCRGGYTASSKLTSELISERYGDLFGLSTASVRPSSVYGPMDRVTASRNMHHVPHRIARMALDGSSACASIRLDAVGDYIHAEDVARAIVSLLHAPRLRYSTYNVACGATASIGEMVDGGGKSAWLWPEIVPPSKRHPAGPPPSGRQWVLTMFRAQRRDRLETAADCARHCMPTWTGWRPSAAPARHRNQDDSQWPYPRDLIGYGARAPHPTGRARPALPSPWCSTTKRARRLACCTATRTRNPC